ncbi:MAG: BON domain-containing protein [Methylophilus sp.]|nr:BON domain-containing protein [Methylophilus sp.]
MNNINTKKTTIALTMLAAGVSFHASAFDTDKVQDTQSSYSEQFNQLDVNKNGLLTMTEAEKDKSLNSKLFAKADKDSDGTLDKNEYAEVKTQVSEQKVSQVVSDSVITTKAKAKLLAEESLKSLKISVETYKGEVVLSGFVADETMKAKAEQVVATVEGVKSIKNGLVVKS